MEGTLGQERWVVQVVVVGRGRKAERIPAEETPV